MTKLSEELRSAMPEETKPVEREAFEQDARKLRPRLDLSRFDSGDYRSPFTAAMFDSWGAALERAAALAEAHNEEHFAKPDAGVYRNCGLAIAINIRALKGRE